MHPPEYLFSKRRTRVGMLRALEPVYEDEQLECDSTASRSVELKASTKDPLQKVTSTVKSTVPLLASTKPKRRALANITNAKPKSVNSGPSEQQKHGADGKSTENSLLEKRLVIDEFDSPERLVGPTGDEQEIEAKRDESLEIDKKVRSVLQKLELCSDDDTSNVSRDDEEPLLMHYDLDGMYADTNYTVCSCDWTDTLPDMFSPIYLRSLSTVSFS